MAKELSLEEELVRGAKRRRFLVRKVSWLGRDGAPDRVLMGHGLTVWVECKNPDGSGGLRDGQARERRLMIEAGQHHWVIETFGELKIFWGWLDEKTRRAA